MKTIHYSASSVMPNTTGVVGLQVLDIDEAEQPTVSLVPIIGWALVEGREPEPVYLWNKTSQVDAIHDPTTGHVYTRCGQCWTNLQDAVQDLAKVK